MEGEVDARARVRWLAGLGAQLSEWKAPHSRALAPSSCVFSHSNHSALASPSSLVSTNVMTYPYEADHLNYVCVFDYIALKFYGVDE
jgi:hypothetical protein